MEQHQEEIKGFTARPPVPIPTHFQKVVCNPHELILMRCNQTGLTSVKKFIKGTRSNDFLLIENCKDSLLVISSNQKLHKLVFGTACVCSL
jgi:hypothetical protein